MNKTYYPINETMAKVAQDINSFTPYTEGSATLSYKAEIDYIYSIVEQIQNERPKYLDKALYMTDRYSKKLAEHLNAYYRNEASCPSVMICGAGNFPVAKKKKQNSRRETLSNERSNLEAYKRKIINILTNKDIILSSDEDAIERLQDKIADLEAEQQKMKDINAYYRKNKTCIGCELLSDDEAKTIDNMLNSGRYWYDVPFPGFKLTNNNATIRNTKARLQKLLEVKEQGTTETENDLFKVVENTELMRLQLFFDCIPDESTRSVLKSNGFKWSPKNQAWQRQLTDNAKWSLKRVIEQLKTA